MSNEIVWRHTETGATLYRTIRAVSGQMFSNSTNALADLDTANWSWFCQNLTETPASSYLYFIDFPTQSSLYNAWYWVDIYKRATADALITDTLLGTILGYRTATGFLPWGCDAVQAASTAILQAIRDTLKLAPSAGDPAAGSVDAHLDSVVGKLPSKSYLAGSNNADGDVQLDEATGALSAAALANCPVTVTPIVSTVSAGTVEDGTFAIYQHGAFKAPTGAALTFTITDEDGDAVNLSAKTLTFEAYRDGEPGTVQFHFHSGGGGNLTVGGTGNNIISLSATDTNTANAGLYRYVIWNTTDDVVVARGLFEIIAEAAAST